jgi:putative ABC transport system substrate-binding protein
MPGFIGAHEDIQTHTLLIRRQVAVIVAPGGSPAALAAKSETTTIPIVFEMSADPIALGLVESLNRPGANLTGVTSLNVEVGPKRLELLRELIPTAEAIAFLVNPRNPTAEPQSKNLQEAAQAFRLQLHVLQASTEKEFETAIATVPQVRAGGLVVGSDPFFATHSEQLAALAVRHAVPAIHQSRDFTIAGGLMSYGGSFMESHRQAGVYAARIIKGDKPADLPVQQVTKVELFINLKAAAALGLTVPLSVRSRADEVIE